jgi:hypothetical protein
MFSAEAGHNNILKYRTLLSARGKNRQVSWKTRLKRLSFGRHRLEPEEMEGQPQEGQTGNFRSPPSHPAIKGGLQGGRLQLYLP